MTTLTAIVAAPGVDGVACAVVVARACQGPFDTLFFDSEHLLDFFDASVQRRLPNLYDLVICDLGVVHTNWDGKLLRPHLMDALRGLVAPVLWFSRRSWLPEDRAAVENIFGEGRLVLSETAPCTASLVRDHFAASDDEYADLMVRFASGSLSEEAAALWGASWRQAIVSLKDDVRRLSDAIGPLIDGDPERLSEQLALRAARIETENRELAARGAEEPVEMGGHKLVPLSVPPGRHAFWREISDQARAQSGAQFCLCQLLGRPVLILSRGPDQRVDLRPWTRYLTDLMPQAHTVGGQPEAVPLFVRGLTEDPGLRAEAIQILRDGAHLLEG